MLPGTQQYLFYKYLLNDLMIDIMQGSRIGKANTLNMCYLVDVTYHQYKCIICKRNIGKNHVTSVHSYHFLFFVICCLLFAQVFLLHLSYECGDTSLLFSWYVVLQPCPDMSKIGRNRQQIINKLCVLIRSVTTLVLLSLVT